MERIMNDDDFKRYRLKVNSQERIEDEVERL